MTENGMSDCLFCKIATGAIQSDLVYEDDNVIAFNDINPQAPTHVLIVPKRHISTLNDLTSADELIIGNLVRSAATIAASQGHAENGYRTVFNCNKAAGQTVFHIHLLLLAGRRLDWPPG